VVKQRLGREGKMSDEPRQRRKHSGVENTKTLSRFSWNYC
jgi:hypothetical protein